MNEVFRMEKKFLINQQQYYELSNYLSKVMILDSNSNGEGYTIRSLYFDSLDDRDFHEKSEGIEIRRKIRLRTYMNNPEFGLLEMKKKQGDRQKKTSLRLSVEESRALIKGKTNILLNQQSHFAEDCYGMMMMHNYQPKSVVTYERKAFIAKENKIRVTFDRNIRGTESNYDIFSNKLNENYLLDPSLVVLEVKYNGFLLSYIKDLLIQVEKSELSVSKYSLSRTISKHVLF